MKTILAFALGTTVGVGGSLAFAAAIIAFCPNDELGDMFDALLEINKI